MVVLRIGIPPDNSGFAALIATAATAITAAPAIAAIA